MEHLLKWRFTKAQADALVENSEFLIAINDATTKLNDFILQLIITRSKLVRTGLNLQTSEWRRGVCVTPEMASLRILLAATNAQVRHWSVHTRLLHSSWRDFLTPEINQADSILRGLFNISGAYHLRVYALPEQPGDEGTLAIRAVSSACILAYDDFFSVTGNREIHSVVARFGVNTDDSNDIHSVAGDIDNVTDDAVTTEDESTIDEDMEREYHNGDDEKGEHSKQDGGNGCHDKVRDNEGQDDGENGGRVVVEVSDSDPDDNEFEKAVTLMIISLDETKFVSKDETESGGGGGGGGDAGFYGND